MDEIFKEKGFLNEVESQQNTIKNMKNESLSTENKENRNVFHAQINSVLLKKLVKIARMLTDTAKLCITPNGIIIEAVDEAMVAMVKLNVQDTAFEKYNATELKLGLDLNRIKKIVDLAKADELITIRFNKRKNQLLVEIDDLKTRIGIVDLKAIPEVNHSILNATGHAILKVDKLNRSLIASDDIADLVVLGIDLNKFELRAEENVNSVELRLLKDDLIELESAAYYENHFSSKYLRDIMQCLDSESLIRICFGDNTPLQIDHNFSFDDSHMTYVLFPLIKPG